VKWDNLPEGWKVKVVTRVAQLNPIDKLPNSWNDRTEVAYIPMENVEDGTGHVKEVSIRPLKDVVSGKTRFRQQDTLFAKITPCLEHKKIAFVESIPTEVGFGSTEFYVLRPNESAVLPKYLCYVLRSDSVIARAVSSMTGTSGRKRVPSHAMRSVVIPLPPLEEQRQIAEILELADELRRERRAANQLINKIIHSLFLDMFGDPASNPKGWEVKKLEELLERNDSGTWGSSPEGKNDSFPVIRSTEITHDGQLVPSTAAIRHVLKIKALKYELRDGDLIVVKSSGSPHLIGRCAKFCHPGDDRQYLFSNFVQRLRPHPQKVTPKYLQLLLNSDYAKEHIARSQSTTSGLRNLSMKHYVTMLVPVPPLFLQQRFAELVSQFEEKRQQMEQVAEELEKLYQSLLKKAFTGELTKQWREVNQIRWRLPQLTERQKVLLAVLYSYNTIQKASPPITMLMKYMFLLQQEKGLELEYAFVPYKFGPFSKEVYEDVEALEKEMLVVHPKKSKNIEKQETALDEDASDDIEAILATLPEDNKKAVGELIEKYGSMGFRELMDYVYTKYPEFATESRRGKERG